jgi:hypothetical protein
VLDERMGEEAAFRALCQAHQLPHVHREIRPTPQGLEVRGSRGEPLQPARLGPPVIWHGPALSEGESPPADALAAAIEACDPVAIRQAIRDGASPSESLPGRSSSPLLAMLFRFGKCDEPHWRACLKTLLDAGSLINGTPPDGPPLVGCVAQFIPETHALAMAGFLLDHGADVNAANPRGETALIESVVYRRMRLVRLLHDRGADLTCAGRVGHHPTLLEWLRHAADDPFAPTADLQTYREMLALLTGANVPNNP